MRGLRKQRGEGQERRGGSRPSFFAATLPARRARHWHRLAPAS